MQHPIAVGDLEPVFEIVLVCVGGRLESSCDDVSCTARSVAAHTTIIALIWVVAAYWRVVVTGQGVATGPPLPAAGGADSR